MFYSKNILLLIILCLSFNACSQASVRTLVYYQESTKELKPQNEIRLSFDEINEVCELQIGDVKILEDSIIANSKEKHYLNNTQTIKLDTNSRNPILHLVLKKSNIILDIVLDTRYKWVYIIPDYEEEIWHVHYFHKPKKIQ